MRLPFPFIAFIGGILLVGLGLLAYLGFATAEDRSWTALIPAFWGIPIILAVIISIGGAKIRKHAMHFVAIVTLLGILAPLGRLIPMSMKEGFTLDAATFTQIAMIVICVILLICAIISFINARRNRKAAEARKADTT